VAADDEGGGEIVPSRTEVAEYMHDLVGQLAEMARSAGLRRSADALAYVRTVIEGEF